MLIIIFCFFQLITYKKDEIYTEKTIRYFTFGIIFLFYLLKYNM